MLKKALILFLVLSALISACSGAPWNDENCASAFQQLYGIFGHFPSGVDWFSIPDYWQYNHGNPSMNGKLWDTDAFASKFLEDCGHLYEVEYTESGIKIWDRAPSPGYDAEESYSWVTQLRDLPVSLLFTLMILVIGIPALFVIGSIRRAGIA
jgi:hypothetical protein